MTDPIEKTVVVPIPPEEAFRLFATRMAEWWPLETHSLSASREGSLPLELVVEPRAGGQILETCADGATRPWARIELWEPGSRLCLAWHVGRPEAEATRVDVRFHREGGGTRVALVHAGFDVLGKSAAEIRDGYDGGWTMVLVHRFGDFASAAAPERAATHG